MLEIDEHELAAHLDRIRRRNAAHFAGVVVRDLGPGWLSYTPGAPAAEYASISPHRLFWVATSRPIAAADIGNARDEARSLGIERLFVWVAPCAFTPAVEHAFADGGAEVVPYVEYIALARGVEACEPARACAFEMRVVPLDEVQAVSNVIAPWYSEHGAAAAASMARVAGALMHAAFDGDRPVAIGMLTIEGAWAYLFGAGTDPACRQRGAQSALIAARVTHAARIGARMCACETNTAVPISLGNLRRLGFVDAIRWRVLKWDIPR